MCSNYANENNKPSVLLVDDDSQSLMILEEYLGQYGYQLSTATDGYQAWLLLENNPKRYDIVLLDWNMPILNGIEVLKRIKAHSQLQHVFVIMQTTNAMEQQIQQGMNAGADDYITKPYNEQNIHSRVEKAIQEINKKL